MRRVIAYLALILLLVPLEETIPALGWPLIGGAPVRPLLHVPLVLYFALRLHTIEGAPLAFATGCVVDFMAPYPFGLAAFTDVGLFVGAKVILAGIRTEGLVFESMAAAILAALFHGTTWGLRRVFGGAAAAVAGTPWMKEHVVACVATALCTPLVFRVARRIERLEAKVPGAIS